MVASMPSLLPSTLSSALLAQSPEKDADSFAYVTIF